MSARRLVLVPTPPTPLPDFDKGQRFDLPGGNPGPLLVVTMPERVTVAAREELWARLREVADATGTIAIMLPAGYAFEVIELAGGDGDAAAPTEPAPAPTGGVS